MLYSLQKVILQEYFCLFILAIWNIQWLKRVFIYGDAFSCILSLGWFWRVFMPPISLVFNTIEAVRLSLNSIGNEHTQSRDKMSILDCRALLFGNKTWALEGNSQNEVCTVSKQNKAQIFRHAWVLLQLFLYIKC